MFKKKSHIKKFTRQKLKDGWTKQEIFEHVHQSRGTEIQNDYKQLKSLARTIRNIPRIETRRKLRLLKVTLILLLFGSCGLGVVLKSHLAAFFGIFELESWMMIPIFLVGNIFCILNLILILPVIQYKLVAYYWLAALNSFTLLIDLPNLSFLYFTYGWYFAGSLALKVVIVAMALLIAQKLPDRYSLEPEQALGETDKPQIWKVLFGD